MDRRPRDGRVVAGSVAALACLAVGIAPSFAVATPPAASGGESASLDDPVGRRSDSIGPMVAPAVEKVLAAPAADALAEARSVVATDSKYPQRSHPEVDVLHHALDLDARGDRIQATDAITFRAVTATSTITLDLARALQISSATLDGAKVEVTRVGDTAAFATGPLAGDSTHVLQVTYAGTPGTLDAPGPDGTTTPVGWFREGGAVATRASAFGASAWLPCQDSVADTALADLRLTTDPDKLAVGGGTLTGRTRDTQATVTTYHLEHAVAPSEMMLAIDDFRWTPISVGTGKVVNLYVRASSSGRDVQDWTTDVQQTMSWLYTALGYVPFASASVLESANEQPGHGAGMAAVHRSGLGLTSSSELVRQMSHQWFGGQLSPRDWRDAWMVTGFGGFAHDLFVSELRNGALPASYDGDCTGAVVKGGPAGDYDPVSFGGANVDRCGAGLLRALHREHGSKQFWLMMKAWSKEAGFKGVDRAAFEAFLAARWKKDHAALFTQWLGPR